MNDEISDLKLIISQLRQSVNKIQTQHYPEVEEGVERLEMRVEALEEVAVEVGERLSRSEGPMKQMDTDLAKLEVSFEEFNHQFGAHVEVCGMGIGMGDTAAPVVKKLKQGGKSRIDKPLNVSIHLY